MLPEQALFRIGQHCLVCLIRSDGSKHLWPKTLKVFALTCLQSFNHAKFYFLVSMFPYLHDIFIGNSFPQCNIVQQLQPKNHFFSNLNAYPINLTMYLNQSEPLPILHCTPVQIVSLLGIEIGVGHFIPPVLSDLRCLVHIGDVEK